MALLLAESWTGYSTSSDFSRFWVLNVGGGTFTTSDLTSGGQVLNVNNNSNAYYIRYIGLSPAATRMQGAMWFKSQDQNVSSTSPLIMNQNTALTQRGGLGVTFSAAGVMTLIPYYWGTNSSTTGTAGTTKINDGKWHLIEWDITFNAGAGICKVWLDGAVELNQSGLTNVVSGTASCDDFSLWCLNLTISDHYFGDLIVFDNTGSGVTAASQPLGVGFRVATIRPSADTATKQFTTTSTGTAHFSLLNELIPNGDTSYVEDSTSGHTDLFDFDDLPGVTASVLSCQANVYVKQASGSQTFNQLAKSSATTTTGTATAISTSYLYKLQSFDLDPNGSIAWTAAALNATQFGFKVT